VAVDLQIFLNVNAKSEGILGKNVGALCYNSNSTDQFSHFVEGRIVIYLRFSLGLCDLGSADEVPSVTIFKQKYTRITPHNDLFDNILCGIHQCQTLSFLQHHNYIPLVSLR